MPFAQPASTVTIDSVSFLPSRVVQTTLQGESTGFPDSAILCLVLVTGQFSFPHPPEATAQFRQGAIVYNAVNGNLIMSGGLSTAVRAGVPALVGVPGTAPHPRPAAVSVVSVATIRIRGEAAPKAAPATLLGGRVPAVPAVPRRSRKPDSYTCTDTHCYALAEWSAQALQTCCLAGDEVDISYTDLFGGDGFVDNEMWLVQHNNPQCVDLLNNINDLCWVEVGMISEPDFFSGTHYFWADMRPGDVFWFHDLGPVPNADKTAQTPTGFFISQPFLNEFQVAIISLQGTLIFENSTNNTMVPDRVEMGQELYGTSGAHSAGAADYTFLTYYSGQFGLPIGVTSSTQLSGSPPFFSWIHQPAGENGGGEFQTQCC
jgi:hypothetical protein